MRIYLKIEAVYVIYSKLTKFTILIQKAHEGGYSGQCLEVPAAISQGETVEELKTNMKESIELALESIKDLKKDAMFEELEINL